MKLQEACEFIIDCPHSTANDEGQGYPLIRTPNIGKGRLILDNVHRVNEQVYNQRNARGIPQDDDLIFAREAPAGNVAIIKNGEKVCLGQRTVLLRPNKSIVNPDYLTYYLLAPKQQYGLTGTANGATVAHVNIPTIRNLEIALPDMPTQNKVANTLKAFDDLIENNQKAISLLEETGQRIYSKWFVDMQYPGCESATFIDGKPDTWSIKELSEVFDYIRGKSYTSKELSDNKGTLMVNLKNIRSFGGYKRNAEKRFIGQFKETQALSAGDLVMGVTDMTQERRLVGHVAIIPDFGEPATFSMDLIKLLPKCVTKNFLYATMFFGGFSKKISPFANGTNVLHLKPDSMMNLKMLIPDEQTIRRFDSVFEPLRKEIEILQNQSESASEARDRLLPKLMNGEIEI